MNTDSVLITETDYSRINSLLKNNFDESLEALENKLNQANVVAEDLAPSDLVTMNSKVRYLEIDNNQQSIISIVYPHDANVLEGKISILSPLASALLGLRETEVINWPFPGGKTKSLKIIKVF